MADDRLGRKGGPYEAGPGGVCACPACGITKEHTTGVPCTEMKCPKCGTGMVREDIVAKQ